MKNKSNEAFLYTLVDELAFEQAPIIFKGGLALKDILYSYNEELNVDRKTIDIDGNWILTYDKEKIENTIKKALNNIDSSLKLEIYREPSDNKSMGFRILDNTGELITKIDLDIKENPFYIVCNINDIERKYSSPEKMMTDKLMVLSGDHIFRRTKDLLDVFLIINNCQLDFSKIYNILNYENKKLGDFSTMLNNKEILKDSYDKLERINNKPDFEEVWDDVINYLEKEKLLNLSIDEASDIEI